MSVPPTFDLLSIGECMIELKRGDDGRFGLGFGGDTFNTAVYAARAGLAAAYASALGDDPYSAGILALAAAEGVATDLVMRVAGRNAGLYLIETEASGERHFHYWRDRAPARELFDGVAASAVAEAMLRARLVYLSGITLSLYAAPALDKLAATVSAARATGARVALDGNYRPRGWGGDAARARAVFERFYRLTDIALPTFDDEHALWGDADPAATIARLAALGVGEIVVKNGPAGAHINSAAHLATGARHIACPHPIAALDTTAAGDSFNAAYLAARLGGAAPAEAALAGHALAAVVIQHRGAIVPRAATAAVLPARS